MYIVIITNRVTTNVNQLSEGINHLVLLSPPLMPTPKADCQCFTIKIVCLKWDTHTCISDTFPSWTTTELPHSSTISTSCRWFCARKTKALWYRSRNVHPGKGQSTAVTSTSTAAVTDRSLHYACCRGCGTASIGAVSGGSVWRCTLSTQTRQTRLCRL